jgi:hypothetical protein
MSAEVTKRGMFDMQVCVPEGWPDNKVVQFAEAENPCGTEGGWQIRRQGSEYLEGCDERVACEDRTGHVHIMLDA